MSPVDKAINAVLKIDFLREKETMAQARSDVQRIADENQIDAEQLWRDAFDELWSQSQQANPMTGSNR